jgi:hypothetical protein
MDSKKCFKCGEVKYLSAFYKHDRMADGHLNKCKECAKNDVRNDYDKNKADPDWIQKERDRARIKYHRLGYKGKHYPDTQKKKEIIKKWRDKYPEKKAAKNASQRIAKIDKSNHLHHWSYNKEHYKDVIELTPKYHAKAHRFIIYDQERMMYRTTDGVLLDTKQNHSMYIMEKIHTEKD